MPTHRTILRSFEFRQSRLISASDIFPLLYRVRCNYVTSTPRAAIRVHGSDLCCPLIQYQSSWDIHKAPGRIWVVGSLQNMRLSNAHLLEHQPRVTLKNNIIVKQQVTLVKLNTSYAPDNQFNPKIFILGYKSIN